MPSKLRQVRQRPGKTPVYPLYNVNGDLGRMVNDHVHKFCGICTWRMQSEERGLTYHFNNCHRGWIASWLKFGKSPLDSLYQNWDKYIEDPETELKLKEGR